MINKIDPEYKNKFLEFFEEDAQITYTCQLLSKDVEVDKNSVSNKKPAKKRRDDKISPDKNYALSLLDLHPGDVRFTDLSERMEPMIVRGLEHFGGILGAIERSDDHAEASKSGNYKNSGLPPQGATVWVHKAYYLDGSKSPFENSSTAKKPHTYVLNEGDTLPGVIVACRSLRPGERGKFLLPHKTMFGELGCPGIIPPRADILLLLHSLKWEDTMAPERYARLDDETKKNFELLGDHVESIRGLAEDYFQRRRHSKAFATYEVLEELLSRCDVARDQEKQVNELKFKTYLNMAICQVKMENIVIATERLKMAARYDECNRNAKYLFTKGRCLSMSDEHGEAFKLLLRALELEPNNAEIGEEILKIDAVLADNKRKERNLWKSMLRCGEEKDREESEDVVDVMKSLDIIGKAMRNTQTLIVPLPSTLLRNEVDCLKGICESNGLEVDVLTKQTPSCAVKSYIKLSRM